MEQNWPAVTYEELPWVRSEEDLLLIPKSARRKIAPTYRTAVPASIRDEPVKLPDALSRRLGELAASLVRFDARQSGRGYNLPAMLLRSESAASSQIENLTSSVRNVAVAQLTSEAPHNALAISGNIAAMSTALSLPDDLTVAGICAIHQALVQPTGESFGGHIRSEQVWVGGTSYSPHGALYVAPAASRVEPCLDDLTAFAKRDDIDPLAEAAIAHAQFETIHPFIDGNGRTGRTLIHKLLRRSEVLMQSFVPVSAGLLHDVDDYLAAIQAYQEGDIIPVVEQLANALETALVLCGNMTAQFDEVFERWDSRIKARKGSAIHTLPGILAEQPVVNTAYLANRLGITPRAANDLVNAACEIGILEPFGSKRRGILYQATDVISILEEASSNEGIRRMLAQ